MVNLYVSVQSRKERRSAPYLFSRLYRVGLISTYKPFKKVCRVRLDNPYTRTAVSECKAYPEIAIVRYLKW